MLPDDRLPPSSAGRRRLTPAARLAFGLAFVAAIVFAAVPARLPGQTPPPSGLHGSVVDARTGRPLEGATIHLEPVPAGMLATDASGGAGFVALARQAVTSEDGAYAFRGLGTGTYRLRVVRIGYRSTAFDVHYEGPADPRVSVGLEVAPVELEPLDITARRSRPASTARTPGGSTSQDERIRLERRRQAEHLTPDARVVTGEDVLEAVTVGETDLLRALQRLPGVVTEDDWSAEPWTRGSLWDETRITYDGLPLLEPMHLGGAFTSVNPDAVGSLTFHPGVRPVDAGDAAAGVVDLRSRPATGEEKLAVLGQLSFLSARFSADRPLGGGSGITLSGRRSYVEDLTSWDEERRGTESIPYRFSDLAGRWDQALGDAAKLEVSGLYTRDRLRGDLPHELKGARGAWGNALLRGTLEASTHGHRVRITRGASNFVSDIDVVPFDTERADLFEAATAAMTRNEVRFDVTELSVAPLATGGQPPRWRAGVRRTHTSIAYRGAAPWPYPDAANAGRLEDASSIDRYAAWGEVRDHIGPDIAFSAGLRLETESGARGIEGGIEAAPRLAVAWTPRPELRVAAAAGRHYQYEQALAATGFTVGSALVPGHFWVGARGAVPPIRADIVTGGAELWLPHGWLAATNGWLRSETGRLTPAPESGYVRARPPLEQAAPAAGWVAGSGRALGLELSARKLAGRWTASLAYSLTRSRTTASDVTYPTPGERTHALDAAFMVKATSKTSVGAALTAASGASYTRFYAFRCTAVSWYCAEVDDGVQPIIGYAEPAGAERTRRYVSLDLHVERTGTLLGLPFGAWAQVRNALGRDNRAAYTGSILDCDAAGNDCSLSDTFESGFPFLPLIGVWIRL
jgi:hypothetical protein